MCISTDPIFYVYVYLDPRKPGYYVYGNYIFEYEPFYVGKGCNGRSHHHLQEWYQKQNKNKFMTRKINKIRKVTGADPFIIKVNEGLTEDISFELERELICVIGRHDEKLGPLCNHTDGGEGSSGMIVSEETRKKQSDAHKGKITSEETKQKMRLHKGKNKGRIVSEETRKKKSIALKGHSVSDEQIQKQKETWDKKRLEREANKIPDPPKPPKWLITYPDGSTIKIVNLSKFCKENGLIPQGLHNISRGNGHTYKGYKCEKIILDILDEM
jgi:hypothetical protein